MVRRFAVCLAVLAACEQGPRYVGVGDVLQIDDARVSIRHDQIAGLKDAGVTAFPLASDDVRAVLTPGARVRFELRRREGALVLTRANTLAQGNPGIHDHTPHHGGVVAMAGMVHLEAKASPDGLVQLYLTDVWRRPLPLDDVEGAVTLDAAGEKRTLPLASAGAALEARAGRLPAPAVNATFALRRAGQPVEVSFLLPLDRRDSGAAGVPADGCVASAEADRCTLAFAKPVVAVALSPDAARLVVAQVDYGISAWRLPAATFVLGFAPPPAVTVPAAEAPHPEAPNGVAVRPDDREAAVAMESRVIVYAMDTGQVVRSLTAPGGIVRALAWSPDGSALLVASFYDPSACLLDAGDGRVRQRFGVEREAAAVAFAPDGRTVAVGSEAGPIALFDTTSAAPGPLLRGARGAARGIGFAGERLVAAGDDGALRIWDATTGAVVVERQLGRRIRALAINAEHDLGAAYGVEPHIELFDLGDGSPRGTLAADQPQILSLAWSGTTLVAGDSAGRVTLWNVPKATDSVASH